MQRARLAGTEMKLVSRKPDRPCALMDIRMNKDELCNYFKPSHASSKQMAFSSPPSWAINPLYNRNHKIIGQAKLITKSMRNSVPAESTDHKSCRGDSFCPVVFLKAVQKTLSEFGHKRSVKPCHECRVETRS